MVRLSGNPLLLALSVLHDEKVEHILSDIRIGLAAGLYQCNLIIRKGRWINAVPTNQIVNRDIEKVGQLDEDIYRRLTRASFIP